jgi:hypothetical protein
MKIRKFVVNDLQLMLEIPSEDRIEALKDNKVLHDIFTGKTPQPSLKIIGILWNYVKDKMYFNFTDLIEHGSLLDKLKMLSILHSLYDPLGVLIPYTITGKLIMQLCWKLGLQQRTSTFSTIFGRRRDCSTRMTTGRSSLGLLSQVSTTSSRKRPVDDSTSSANSPGFEARGRT